MGAVLDSSKRGIDPHKVKVFALMWRLRTGKEVQKVLRYLNFLRDFIPLYANIVGLMEGLRSAKVILNDLWKESGGEFGGCGDGFVGEGGETGGQCGSGGSRCWEWV